MCTPQIPVLGHHFMHAWGLGWLMFDQISPEERSFLFLANAYPAFGIYEDVLRSLTDEGLIRTGRPFEMGLGDCADATYLDDYRLHVRHGAEHLRYAYSERQCLNKGDLVLSGAGGFASMSEKNILAGSISFIPTPDTAIPGYVRIGQRFARRMR
jgi:hypothetical protein